MLIYDGNFEPLHQPVLAKAPNTTPSAMAFENICINLTKEELIERLFPHFSLVSFVHDVGPESESSAFQFEFKVSSQYHHDELQKIKKGVEDARATTARKATEAEDPILGQRICDQSSLGVRVMNAMKANDIETVGDLIQHTRKEVLGFRNMGRVGIKELDKLLKEHNLKFKKV